MRCYTRCHARYWRFTEETVGKGEKSEPGETERGFILFNQANETDQPVLAPHALRTVAVADFF